jgi:hypothetical protein
MKKLLAATLIAFALATPAMAFDLGSIDGIPSDMKDTIAKQSGGRISNKQGQQQGLQGQQQAGQDGQQQQGGRKSRKKLSAQDKAMQQADQFMNGGGGQGQGLGQGQGIGSIR